MSHHRFTYRSVPGAESAMLERLDKLLRDNDISDHDRRSFLLAVSEAFTNALVHGNRFDESKEIKLEVSINEADLVADITDEGQGGLQNIENKRVPDLLSDGGRGIDLMRYCATSVEFSTTQKGGLSVTITLNRCAKLKVK